MRVDWLTIFDMPSRTGTAHVVTTTRRYKDQVYRFLVNGQTGRATGQAPVSWRKVIAAIAVVALLAFVLFLILLGVAAA